MQQLALRDLSLVSCSQLRSCCIGLRPAPTWGAREMASGAITSFVEVDTSVERKSMMTGYSLKRHLDYSAVFKVTCFNTESLPLVGFLCSSLRLLCPFL